MEGSRDPVLPNSRSRRAASTPSQEPLLHPLTETKVDPHFTNPKMVQSEQQLNPWSEELPHKHKARQKFLATNSFVLM